MREKRNVFSIILVVVSLIMLGYILFISVFNQIITQNEGFFYMVVFGGILVLAFILLSLMTKLFAVSHEIEERKLWYFMEGLAIIALFVLFYISRMSYTSSLPPEDTAFYKAAVLLQNGTLSVSGMDLLPQLMRNPAQYVYALFVSLIFRIAGANAQLIIYINISILLLTVFFVYRIVRRIGGRLCGMTAVVCSLFMPSQAFSVYSYNPELFFSLILFISLDLFIVILSREKENKAAALVLYFLLGLSFAILLFMEPLAIIAIALMLLAGVTKKKIKGMPFILCIITGLAIYALFFFVKCNRLECTGAELIEAYAGRFTVNVNAETGEQYDLSQIMNNFHTQVENQDSSITDNYYFLTKTNGQTYSALQAAWFQLGNQLLYMFFIVLSIACVFYVIRGNNERIIPCLALFAGAVPILFFSANKENNTYFFVELLIIISCSSLHYMYENHHPEAVLSETKEVEAEAVKAETEEAVETEEEQAARLLRARALIFIGENEALYKEIKSNEKGNQEAILSELGQSVNAIMTGPEKVKLLDNPLPLPKRHEAKTLDYKVPVDEYTDYDYPVSEEDDFDV